MRLDVAAGEIVSRLTEAGISSAVDPRDLNLPAVWVQLDHVESKRLDRGAYRTVWQLTVIAADVGTMQALATLGALSDKLIAVFPTVRGGDTTAILLPGGPDPMPALLWTVDLLCNDDPPATTHRRYGV